MLSNVTGMGEMIKRYNVWLIIKGLARQRIAYVKIFLYELQTLTK